jgi:hypothetical protein
MAFTTTKYGFGMLIIAETGFMLRGATREELLATIPIDARRIPVTIKVDIDGTVYDCTVKYQQ